MALDTYADLQAAISNWTAGQLSTDRIQECIALAEAEMSRKLYENSAETSTSTTTTASVDYVMLPADCRLVRDVSLDEAAGHLSFLSPSAWHQQNTLGEGRPAYYTVEGLRIRFSPVPDSARTVNILYQQGITALSDSNTTNALFPRHADGYMACALKHAYDFLMDETRAAKWQARFDAIWPEMFLEYQRTRFAGPLRMRSPYRE